MFQFWYSFDSKVGSIDTNYSANLHSNAWANVNGISGKVQVCQCFAIIAFLMKFLGVVIMPINGIYAMVPKDLLSMLTQSFYLFIMFICSSLIVIITWSTIPSEAFETFCLQPQQIADDDDGVGTDAKVNCYPDICTYASSDSECVPTGKASSFIFTIIMVIVVIGLIYSSKHFSKMLKEEIRQNESTKSLNSPTRPSDFTMNGEDENLQGNQNDFSQI